MAATIRQIARYLDWHRWTYELDEDNSRIFTGLKTENVENLRLAIALEEDGEYFQLAAPQLLTGIKDYIYKNVLFQTLLTLSWETKTVRWKYDPIAGEVSAMIEFPLEDSVLTPRQFDRCLGNLIELVDGVAIPRLLTVVETGIDPGEKQLGEKLLLSLQEILPGSLTLLEEALTARKQRGLVKENENR